MNTIIDENVINIIRQSEFFDTEYYKSQFDILWDQIDPVLHFYFVGTPFFISPSREFDIIKYFAKNPDVYHNKVNPLYHYEVYGRFELRSRFRVFDNFNKNEELKYLVNSYPLNTNITYKHQRAAIFASYNKDYVIKDYIIYYLEHLRDIVDIIIFVSDNYYPPYEINRITHLIDCYKCEMHGEYDFGSYKRGIEILRQSGILGNLNELILCNDSAYGPLYSFDKILSSLDLGNYDFYGLSNAVQGNDHVQSYFYIFSNTILQDDTFYNFFEQVKKEQSQADVIKNYEIRLTKIMKEKGYKYKTLLNIYSINANNDYFLGQHPIKAIQFGLPFIKRKKFKDYIQNHDGIMYLLDLIKSKNFALYNIINEEHLFNNIDANISFSIIVPTYNRREIIANAIDSALMQSYQNFEIIIIDDGSTDSTDKYIYNKYREHIKNRKMIYKRIPKNYGAAYARNVGLYMSKGKWICYLDSDNIMEPCFLEYFARAITENKRSDIFYSKFIRYPEMKEEGKPFDWDKLTINNYIDLGVFVHKKKLINKYGNFDVTLKRLIDYEFILRLVKNDVPIFLDIPLLKYNNSGHDRISKKENFSLPYAYIKKKYSNKTLISTIITSYNQEKYISRAIESALTQNGDFIHEVLISDDGSTDKTYNIIKEYSLRYPDLIRDISNKKNLGISKNMKKCITKARGKFISVLEGDDYWIDPYKLNKQYFFLNKNPDCQMCFSGSYILNDKTLKISTPKRYENLKQKIHLKTLIEIHNPMVTFSATFYKAIILKTVPDCLYRNRISEYALAFYFTEYGNIGFIPDKCVVYRQHPGSAWTGLTREQQLLESINTYKNIILIDKNKYQKLFKNRIQSIEDELCSLSETEKLKTFFDSREM